MSQPLGTSDALLFCTLLYACGYLVLSPELFGTCRWPIHVWLIGSYTLILGFRVVHALGVWRLKASASSSPDAARLDVADLLLNFRQKEKGAQFIAVFTWMVALPVFMLWTGLGSYWLVGVARDSPQCVPSSAYLWFHGFWLALSYTFILVHLFIAKTALALEWRIRRAEAGLRAVEDDDVIARWGHVSSLPGYEALPGYSQTGLSPEEIRDLPCRIVSEAEVARVCHEEITECAICINEFQAGECVRQLPGCEHSFHKSCIDLWLLRCSHCPLCKGDLRCHTGSCV